MKFSVTKDNLSAGLSRVMSAVSTKPMLPILSNVLLEAQNGQLCITAFDTEMRIKTAVTALVEVEGAITIQAKKFNEVVRSLPNGDISIQADDANPETVNLSCQKSKYKLRGMKSDTFPAAEPFSEEWGFSIGGKELVDALVKVAYARSEDESREALSGVLFSIRGGMRTVAATDGRRLALVEKAIDSAPAEGDAPADKLPTKDGEFILPSKVVYELIGSLDQSKSVMVHLMQSMAVFETGETTVMSKLVDKSYPNYRSVIPVQFKNQVSIPRALFADVLKRISTMTSDAENSNAVKFEINEKTMVISASSMEFGDANEEIDVELTGEPVTISFNPAFLVDPIKNLKCDKFVLNYNDGVTPVEITGDTGFIYIIMPMRNL